MPRAYSLIRPAVWYRREAFVTGLRRAGFEVLEKMPDRARPGDVLVQWNRYASYHGIASRFEQEGGVAMIAENGYLNADGGSPKFAVHPSGGKPTDYYAIGLGFHNDAERVPAGGPERWAALGVRLKPWRTDGEHILICPNRSFGVPGRMMPTDWAERCAERLRKATRRPVVVRPHPGNDAPKRPLSADLKGAWCVVIWSSSSGVHALVEGLPVICCAPFWICKGAAGADLARVDDPPMPDREPAMQRLAYGQWQLREIETGLPFRHILAPLNGLEKVK